MSRPLAALDIELGKYYFMIGLKRFDDGKYLHFTTKSTYDKATRKKIRSVLSKYTVITFNGMKFDMPLIYAALQARPTKQLFDIAQDIIANRKPDWLTMRDWEIEPARDVDHCDLIESSPAVFVGLKKYGARMGSKKLQELPYAYDKVLSDSEIDETKAYNKNDLDLTEELYYAIEDRIDLRIELSKQYKMDLRSKSDPQIAETVILKQVGYSGGRPDIPKSVTYTAPKYITFVRNDLQELLLKLLTQRFSINKGNGNVEAPDWLKNLVITIGNTEYQLGIGGIHAKISKLVCEPKEDEVIIDADIQSMYPSIIIQNNLAPKHLGLKFISTYKKIYAMRLDPETGAKVMLKKLKNSGAKKEDMKHYETISSAVKIFLNGSYGKLSSKYSKMYAPEMLLAVTLTGQLTMLMIIEQLELNGIKVLASNTDSITYICKKDEVDFAESIVFDIELESGLIFEFEEVKRLYMRDINAYIAIHDGYAKAKGLYAAPTLNKDSEYAIVFTAIRQFLLDRISIEKTIKECTDIRQFVTSRVAKYGGYWRGEYLGKLCRYYYSIDGDPIMFTSPKTGNENKVAKSDGCRPAMELPNKIPRDLDYDKYIALAYKHLHNLGVEK